MSEHNHPPNQTTTMCAVCMDEGRAALAEWLASVELSDALDEIDTPEMRQEIDDITKAMAPLQYDAIAAREDADWVWDEPCEPSEEAQ